MNGYINLLKPPGMSSGAAVAVVKRLTGERVGHAGTLDPEAAGVLPIMIGRATRVLDYFPDKSKSYVAQIAFAGETDTQDAQGVLLTPCEKVPGREEIEKVLARFTGVILQRPPAYSAIKIGGKPLYALARKGEMVEAKLRETEIRSLTLGDPVGQDAWMLFVDCGSGTYIRTLCHDIGKALSAPAHMRFLLRTRHGGFSIEHAVTIEEVMQAAERGELEKMLLPMDEPLQSLRRLDVAETYATPVKNGAKLPLSLFPEAEEEEIFRVYLNNTLCGLYRKDQDVLHCCIGLYQP
ncbi:MAG: tRNA pseudouridine(55) synthase TruB [Clostridia bacterium]|nr:tRNA pseudouridine(55) synthase TruB [Clostridia bacterium]